MADEIKTTCCDDPRPRMLESNGRMFCGNCKAYLDRREPAQAPLPETPTPLKVSPALRPVKGDD